MDKVGRICFIVGVVVSIIAGFITANWIFVALTILGLVVGFLNLAAKEVQSFLLAAIGLVIISAMGSNQITALLLVGTILGRIYTALLTFVSPAAIKVALKSIFNVASK